MIARENYFMQYMSRRCFCSTFLNLNEYNANTQRRLRYIFQFLGINTRKKMCLSKKKQIKLCQFNSSARMSKRKNNDCIFAKHPCEPKLNCTDSVRNLIITNKEVQIYKNSAIKTKSNCSVLHFATYKMYERAFQKADISLHCTTVPPIV